MIHHHAANHRSRKWAATRLPSRWRQGGYLRRYSGDDAEQHLMMSCWASRCTGTGARRSRWTCISVVPSFTWARCASFGCDRPWALPRARGRSGVGGTPVSCWWELLETLFAGDRGAVATSQCRDSVVRCMRRCQRASYSLGFTCFTDCQRYYGRHASIERCCDNYRGTTRARGYSTAHKGFHLLHRSFQSGENRCSSSHGCLGSEQQPSELTTRFHHRFD